MTTQPERSEIRSVRKATWGRFRYLLGATGVSSIGDGLRISALPLLTLHFTREPILVALVTIFGTLPLLLSPLAGVAADRWSRKRILYTVDFLRFLVVLSLAISIAIGVAQFWTVLVAATLLGMGEVFFVVAGQSFLPQVVSKSVLHEAYGRQQTVQVLGRDVIGQPIGGLFFFVGMSVPFFIDSVTFLLGVLLIGAVSLHKDTTTAVRPKLGWFKMVGEGFALLTKDKLLLRLAIMLGCLNFVVAGVGSLLVLYFVQVLRVDASFFGFFLTAGALGGAAAGIFSANWAHRFGVFPTVLGGMLLGALALITLSISTLPWLAFVLYALMQYGFFTYQALTVSFRQAYVPSEILGRVNGAYRFIGTGSAPLGALFAGTVATITNLQLPFLIAGVLIAVVALSAVSPFRKAGMVADAN